LEKGLITADFFAKCSEQTMSFRLHEWSGRLPNMSIIGLETSRVAKKRNGQQSILKPFSRMFDHSVVSVGYLVLIVGVSFCVGMWIL